MADAEGQRTYDNGEIRVIWRPVLCAHSGVCAGERPWVVLAGTPSERIVAQVEQCPSGALSWERA